MLWEVYLNKIRETNRSTYAVLRSCRHYIDEDGLTIFVRFKFHSDRLNDPKSMTFLKQVSNEVFKPGMNIQVIKGTDEQFSTNKPNWIGEL